MSELRSVVATVCCVVGIVLLIGGIWAHTRRIYRTIYGEIYPYRIYSLPFIICGIALLVAGIVVYWLKADVDGLM